MHLSTFLALMFNTLPALSTGVGNAIASCTAKATPDLGGICGQPQNPSHARGGVFPTAYSSQYLDFNSCVEYCSGIGCAAVSYNNKTSLCTFFNGDGFKSQVGSSTLYYNLTACFTCTRNCKPPPSINLLFDPNFIDSKKLIGPWTRILEPPYVIVPNPIGQGNAIWYPFKKNSDNTGAGFGQSPLICENEAYLLSVDYKVDKFGPTPADKNESDIALTQKIDYQDCEEGTTFTYGDKRYGKWQHAQCGIRLTSASNSSELVGPNVGLSANTASNEVGMSITWANARLTRLPDADIKTTGPSLVTNGGFESGKVAPWHPIIYYETEKKDKTPARCNDSQPIIAVESPGLPAQGGTTRASKYHLNFCGIPKGAITNDVFGYTQFAVGVSLTISQRLAPPPDPTKNYVFTMQYAANGGDFSNVQVYLSNKAGRNHVQFKPSGNTNGTVVYQSVFSGLNGLSNVTINVNNIVSGVAPFPNIEIEALSFEVDNISIKEAAS